MNCSISFRFMGWTLLRASSQVCSGIYYFYSKTGTLWKPWASTSPKWDSPHRNQQWHPWGGFPTTIMGSSLSIRSASTGSAQRTGVMRKHIGRALLASPGHPNADYLPIWNADMTTPDKRNAYRHLRSIAVRAGYRTGGLYGLGQGFDFRCVACESDGEGR